MTLTPSTALPNRLVPRLSMHALNEPIMIRDSGLALRLGSRSAPVPLTGSLRFRWQPSVAVEFEGECSLPGYKFEDEAALLLASPPTEAGVIISHVHWGGTSQAIRCVLKSEVELWHSREPVDRVSFYLVNFPSYIGSAIRLDNSANRGWSLGRMALSAPQLACTIDEIAEAKDLREQAEREAGYVISHVGEIVPSAPLAPDALSPLMGHLHLFLGFARGAWCGPMFPEGYKGQRLVWEPLATWHVDDPNSVGSWLPQRSPISLSALFENFLASMQSSVWSEPLKLAVSWYVAANSTYVPHEARIVLSQLALDLIANVELVEVRSAFSHEAFERLGAARRVQELLRHFRIPEAVPTYLSDLDALARSRGSDGPSILVFLRNRLVHATEQSRRALAGVDGVHYMQAADLALSYVELSLLALLGYSGKYSRRGWHGWKGEDEVDVPWV